MSRRKSGGLWETVRTIFYAVLIALVVRTVLFEPFNIPSGSMIPTLLVGDYLFVSKYAYGYSRFSLPLGLPLFEGRIFSSPPRRGDVVVFKLPGDDRVDYIKRVVGLPGDRIQVRRGVLRINGRPVERQRLADYVVDGRRFTQYREILPNGRSHRIVEVTDSASLDNTRIYEVPPGHYFVMGDNRDNSLDSRVSSGVGFVPAENLIGRAEVIFFSTNGRAEFWEVWKWPVSIRYGRLLEAIE